MRVGTVRELWRYPVKSMAGERMEEASFGMLGIPGDRGYALRDEEAGEIRGAKKFPALMQCAARYLEEPSEDHIPAAEMALPDGVRIRTDDAAAGKRLSLVVGKPVTLWPRRPADDLEHYRRHPDGGDIAHDLKEMFGRESDEPMPSLEGFPEELFVYTSPLGTYFDAYPLLLLTTGWLAELGKKNPEASFDVRRFRPNVLIDTGDGSSGFFELEWAGHEVRVGEAVFKIELPCPRCVMTTQQVGELPKDPSILRTIVKESDQKVGIYASVATPGKIRVGDPVEVL